MKKSSDNKYRWTLKNTLSLYKFNSLLWKLERVRKRIRWGGEHSLLVKKSSRQRPKDKSICRQQLSTLIEINAILSGIYKGTWHWLNLFLLQWMGLLLVGLAEAMLLKTAPWNHPYLPCSLILENVHIISTIKYPHHPYNKNYRMENVPLLCDLAAAIALIQEWGFF